MFKKLFGSLDNTQDGWSARKLTAFASIITAIYVTYTLPLDVRLHALYAWQALALLCLGIVTFEQILKFKSGGTEKDKVDATKKDSEQS